jgi:DNA-binding MarR family transcriptional regulator
MESMFTDLVRFQIVAWNAVDARLKAEHDLTLGSFEILRVIETTPNCRVNDIAEQMVITVGGVSKIVDRLESAGLVERSANPDDRRSSIVGLAASGISALEEASVTVDSSLAELFAGVGDDFAATLRMLRSR